MYVQCNIMIVEDEALIALDLAFTLEEMGAEVCGPFHTVRAALPRCGEVDAAVLDVDLHGEAVYPVADRLRECGTPFLFHTARADTAALVDRYGPDTAILAKPARVEHLRRGLISLINRRAAPSPHHADRLRTAS